MYVLRATLDRWWKNVQSWGDQIVERNKFFSMETPEIKGEPWPTHFLNLCIGNIKNILREKTFFEVKQNHFLCS